MDSQALLEWGRMHHFPQLVLNTETGEVLYAGRFSWLKLVRSGDRARIERAVARVRMWQARQTTEQEVA